jgi:hypothetical protein
MLHKKILHYLYLFQIEKTYSLQWYSSNTRSTFVFNNICILTCILLKIWKQRWEGWSVSDPFFTPIYHLLFHVPLHVLVFLFYLEIGITIFFHVQLGFCVLFYVSGHRCGTMQIIRPTIKIKWLNVFFTWLNSKVFFIISLYSWLTIRYDFITSLFVSVLDWENPCSIFVL